MAVATTTLEQQSRYLANESRDAYPDVQTVLWFPAVDQIRLIVLTPEAITSDGDVDVCPFYFQPSPEDGLDFWSATELIQPNQRGKLRLPAEWGTWLDAVEI